MKKGILINTASIENILFHFRHCKSEFIEEIITEIQLDDYIKKIFNNAYLYEYWDDNDLVAIVATYINKGIGKPAYITIVSVMNDYSGRGIGKLIINYALNDLKQKHFNDVELEVKKNNDIALQLYNKLGFSIKNENFGKNNQSYLMNKEL